MHLSNDHHNQEREHFHQPKKSCQKLGAKHGSDSPSEPPGKANAADVLILGFWPPKV